MGRLLPSPGGAGVGAVVSAAPGLTAGNSKSSDDSKEGKCPSWFWSTRWPVQGFY
jgi:hypothetical protein